MKMSRTSSNDLGHFHLVFHHWTAVKYQPHSEYKIKQDFGVCLPKFHSASNFKQMCTTLLTKLNKNPPDSDSAVCAHFEQPFPGIC